MSHHQISVGGEELVITTRCPEEAKKCQLPNWSLSPIQSQLDALRWPGLANGFRRAFSKEGVTRVYAPHVSAFSARVVEEAVLRNHIYLGDVILHRNDRFPADGVFIKKNHSFAMNSAGCSLIIATADGHMVVAQAGRNSLIDRGAVEGKPTRLWMGVVDCIIGGFSLHGIPPASISMRMLFSIPTMLFEHRFDHPQYGAYNYALSVFVNSHWPSGAIRQNGSMFLDLESVFREQAYQAGVKDVEVTHSLLEYPDLAHTRDGKDPSRRNLFIVRRCS
jgi:hypothetical protein